MFRIYHDYLYCIAWAISAETSNRRKPANITDVLTSKREQLFQHPELQWSVTITPVDIGWRREMFFHWKWNFDGFHNYLLQTKYHACWSHCFPSCCCHNITPVLSTSYLKQAATTKWRPPLMSTQDCQEEETAVWCPVEKVNLFEAWISSSKACETGSKQSQEFLISFLSPCYFLNCSGPKISAINFAVKSFDCRLEPLEWWPYDQQGLELKLEPKTGSLTIE